MTPRRVLVALVLALLLTARGIWLLAADDPKPAPLTEIETLRVQNVALEGQIVQRALNDWQAKVAKLKADLEAPRAGWVWSPDTGAWTPKETKK
jgi:hypothetical protein